MAIQQELSFKTRPETLYQALISASEFASATGAPADIVAEAGGAFSCFGGQITGRTVELVPNQRIVQAWRAGPWPASVYSIVSFSLRGNDQGTVLSMEQHGYPEGEGEHLEGGWHKMYWDPIRAHVE